MHTKEIVDEFKRSTTGISCYARNRVGTIPLSFLPEPQPILVRLTARLKREFIRKTGPMGVTLFIKKK